MADLQITGLPALAEAGIQATDVAAVADISATETKKVTIKDLIAAGVALIDDGDIPAAKVATLATNQVATGALQANAVTAAKIANATITATQIADATITGAKLVNDTVTATQIAANAITASELADNAVDTAAIAANAVTTAKITDANVTYAKLSLSDGDIPGAKIATGGITATQLAANSVTSSELADNAVDTAAIVDGAVTAVKIATNTITANQIAANAIGASELADNAVDTAAIADGAVTAAKLSGTLAATSIADNAVTTAKILDDAVTSAKLAANAVDATALADNAVDSGAIASTAVTEAKLASSAVTNAKIADSTITPAKLNTSNLDRSLNVASGNLGINNTITAATRSGITYNAQGLITGTVALAAGDLPVATTSAVGGVSVGTGLSVSGAGALSITNSVTGATVSGITFNAQGMITAATALVAGDLPTATTSAKGAVQITSGGGLTVDGSGNLTTSTSGVSAGTYQSVTVNNKGVITAGAALTAGLIPDLSASKITSGSIDAARIGTDSIDGTKLSNTSTAIFQSIAQSGYPTAQFNGQILFDTVSEDAYIWDGNAWQAITTLTKGSLVFGGNYNANTSKMTACTSAGLAAGLAVGSNLPTPSSTTDGLYVVVDTAGTPSAPAPVVAFSPPDYILGVTNSAGSSWNEIDLSQTVAGQVASNITFTPYGQLSSTNVQDALQELETEKLALAGGTVTGQVLIGNTGSLVFEGSTIDAYETTITVADPTSSDKTITFPDTTGTVITSGDTNTVTSTMVDASLVNANLASGAAIAFSKLAALTSAQILVGNGSNVPTAVAVTGDISINNAGLTSIAAGVIVDADISGSAAITGSKIATGTTSAVGVLQLTDSATSTSATTAATPAAVKIAKDAADAAATTANAALATTGGVLTGHLTLDDEKELRFREEDAGGDHYIALKAAAALAADVTLTLPAVAPTAGQVLKADASTPTTLTWAADSATDSTKMPLAGGTFTGDVTFTGDSSNGLWDKSASAFVANLTGNVTGNVSGSAATVTGAAQSAITSLGTLTGLTVDGDVTLTGASANVTWDKSTDDLIFNDNAKAIFGTSSDGLELFHNGSHSVIKEAGTGALKVVTNSSFQIRNADEATGEYLINANVDGAVELYHNGLKTLYTDSLGFSVKGGDTSSKTQLSIWGNEGQRGVLQISADDGDDNADHWQFQARTDGNLNIQNLNSGSWGNSAVFVGGGAAMLYNNNVKVLETVNNGIKVSGSESGDALLYLSADEGDDNADQWRVKADTSGNFGIDSYSTGSWVNGLTVDGSGNVGIGRSSGLELLDVKGGNDESIKFSASDYGGGHLRITGADKDISGSAGPYNYTTRFKTKTQNNNGGNGLEKDALILYHEGWSGLNVASFPNSKLGVGIAEPDCELEVQGATDPKLKLESQESGNKRLELWIDGGTAVGYIAANQSASSLQFQTTNTTALTLDSSQNATFAGTVSDSKGDLRKIPRELKSSAYTLVLADAGKTIATNSGVTVPNNVMGTGDAVTIVNNSGSDITITQASSLSMYNAADAATGNRTLAGRGMATVWFSSGSEAYISGAGLS